jgi:hypothetical protein
MNFLDPRINNFSEKIWYVDPRSPLTLQNYKILLKKNPKIQNLNKVASKIGAAPTKQNINRVLKSKKFHDPKEITIKVKKRKIQKNTRIINNVLRELYRLQNKI